MQPDIATLRELGYRLDSFENSFKHYCQYRAGNAPSCLNIAHYDSLNLVEWVNPDFSSRLILKNRELVQQWHEKF